MSSVIQYSFPTSLPWTEKLVAKLSEPNYRHAYMVEGVKTWIARQVRTLREQRGWSQEDLGRTTGKPQSAISRVEDPDYGKLTLQTLFDMARAYDLPLLVQFVEWSDWLSRMNDTSTETLRKESFNAAALTDVGAGQIFIEPKYSIDPALSDQSRVWARHVFPVVGCRWATLGMGTNMSTGAVTAMSILTGTTIEIAKGYVTYNEPRRYVFDHEEDDFELDEDLIPPAAYLTNEIAESENG